LVELVHIQEKYSLVFPITPESFIVTLDSLLRQFVTKK
jgi:hypothetical protein